jgi:hypothetical protein
MIGALGIPNWIDLHTQQKSPGPEDPGTDFDRRQSPVEAVVARLLGGGALRIPVRNVLLRPAPAHPKTCRGLNLLQS